jgi:hypothetical protein
MEQRWPWRRPGEPDGRKAQPSGEGGRSQDAGWRGVVMVRQGWTDSGRRSRRKLDGSGGPLIKRRCGKAGRKVVGNGMDTRERSGGRRREQPGRKHRRRLQRGPPCSWSIRGCSRAHGCNDRSRYTILSPGTITSTSAQRSTG